MTNPTNSTKHVAYSNFTIFRSRSVLDQRNGASNGSFPQNVVSMPRPSRLSETSLAKNPADKEVTPPGIVKRRPHAPYQIILAETPRSERTQGRVQAQSQDGQAS